MRPAAQHLICTAHRPPAAAAFDPNWRSETVTALARGIVANWAFDRLPILADALEEAGCDDPVVLGHCRECNHHTGHCWLLGDLFDRPPLARPVRLTDDEVRRQVERITGPLPEPGDRRGPNTARVWMLVPVILVVVVAASVRTFVRLTPPATFAPSPPASNAPPPPKFFEPR